MKKIKIETTIILWFLFDFWRFWAAFNITFKRIRNYRKLEYVISLLILFLNFRVIIIMSLFVLYRRRRKGRSFLLREMNFPNDFPREYLCLSKFTKARFRIQDRSMYLDWIIKNFARIYTTFSWMLHFQSWYVDFARDKLDYYVKDSLWRKLLSIIRRP